MKRLKGLISRVIRASLGSLAGGGAALLVSQWAVDQLDFDNPASAFKDLQGLFGTATVAAIGFGLAIGVWLALKRGMKALTPAAITPAIAAGLVLAMVLVGPDKLTTATLLIIYATAGALAVSLNGKSR